MFGYTSHIIISYTFSKFSVSSDRSRPPKAFLGKAVLKICSRFTGEHPYRSVNLLPIFRSPYFKKKRKFREKIIFARRT